MVDADSKFLWVDVGANESDCAVFNNSDIKAVWEDGTLGLLPAEPLSGDDQPMPYFLIRDDTLPLHEWLMKS